MLKGAVQLDAGEVATLSREAAEAPRSVFNPDGRRRQLQLDPSHSLVQKLKAALAKARLLEGRDFGLCVALHSRVECARQDWHTDFKPVDVANLALSGARTPRSAILALEAGTRLCVSPHNSGYAVELLLEVGDVLVFDGDLVHAGSAYPDRANTRLHVYLEVDGICRPPDTTWRVDTELAIAGPFLAQ